MAKKRKYNSFTFYTQHNILRVVLLSIFAGTVGVVLGVLVLFYVV